MTEIDEARLQAMVKWAIACQRLTFELSPLNGGIWDEVPRDLQAALQLARAALAEIEAAHRPGTLLGRNDPLWSAPRVKKSG